MFTIKHQWNVDAVVDIEYSIIIPVYNQEQIIVENIHRIIINTVGSYELIIIFDGCTDRSENVVVDYFKSNEIRWKYSTFSTYHQQNQPKSITCVELVSSVFETKADNIGFRLAKGIYWIDIQADMKVFTYGYNYLLSKPCRLWDDIFAVSGRCCHQWSNHSIGMGKMTGHQMEHRLKHTDDNNNEPFYISETINRGPLLFVGHRLKELDYLDDDNFILENDDHDVMARAYFFYGWKNGYVPIDVVSHLSDGSTRKPQAADQRMILQLGRSNSEGGFFNYAMTSLWYRNKKRNEIKRRSMAESVVFKRLSVASPTKQRIDNQYNLGVPFLTQVQTIQFAMQALDSTKSKSNITINLSYPGLPTDIPTTISIDDVLCRDVEYWKDGRKKIYLLLHSINTILLTNSILNPWRDTLFLTKPIKNDRVVTIVSAASETHAYSLLQLLKNIAQPNLWTNMNVKKVNIVLFDLGMTKEQLPMVKAMQNELLAKTNDLFDIVIQPFDFEKYPEFYKMSQNRGNYAWKPSITATVMNHIKTKQSNEEEKEILIWFDSGNYIHKPLKYLLRIVETEGVYMNESDGGIGKFTHEDTLRLMNWSDKNVGMRNAACIGFDCSRAWVRELIQEWQWYSSRCECISPTGSSLKNHRYDQSILSILYHQYHSIYHWDHSYVERYDKNLNGEYSIHNDADKFHHHMKQLEKIEQQAIINAKQEEDNRQPKNPFYKYRKNIKNANGEGEEGIVDYFMNQLSASKKEDHEVFRINSSSGELWKTILLEHNPKLVIVKINSTVRPDVSHGTSSYYPMVKLGIDNGYQLACHTHESNLIFLRKDMVQYVPEMSLVSDDPLKFASNFFLTRWLQSELDVVDSSSTSSI